MPLSNCEQCGVPLSAPNGRCQQCGHTFTLTSGPIERTLSTASTPIALEIETDNPAGFDLHGLTSSEDEATKVESLLGRIAAQSHFEERYELRGTLASGGMGQIYRAYDRILKREVAIKMMRDTLGVAYEVPAVRGQFLKEARIGGRLLHPNILAVFDLGVNKSGHIYYTMRLVDGASLQLCLDALDKGVVTKLISYPLRKLIEAFVAACQGIDYAHQNGVIHLDLKPHNILVSGFNEVFVIDWGLARVDEVDDTEVLADLYQSRSTNLNTSSATGVFEGRVVGTPGYMAPEQARGDIHSFDAATDVFGLGGILYFLLYGKAPNQGASVKEILDSSAAPKSKGQLRLGILPRGQRVRREARAALEALETICLKALAVDPKARYQDAEQMIVDLNEWLTHTPEPPAGF